MPLLLASNAISNMFRSVVPSRLFSPSPNYLYVRLLSNYSAKLNKIGTNSGAKKLGMF